MNLNLVVALNGSFTERRGQLCPIYEEYPKKSDDPEHKTHQHHKHKGKSKYTPSCL